MRANDDYNNLNHLYVESIGMGAGAEGEGLQRSIQTEIKAAKSKPVFKKDCENCVTSDDKCPECEEATSVKEILKVINDIVRKMYREVEDNTCEIRISKLKELAKSLYDIDSPESSDQSDEGNDTPVNDPTEGGVP